MAKAIDLTGKQFGYLKVLERDFDIQKEHPNERQAWWKCKCEACGNIKSIRGSILRKKGTYCCGCSTQERKEKFIQTIQTSDKFKEGIKKTAEKNRLDLTGQRFTKLLVLEYADEDHQVYYNNTHKTTWKCQCDCGNICYVTTENLRRGDTPSCGCITKENRHATLNDLTGQRFGHLKVLKWIGNINNNTKYLVQCDCGKIYEINASNLTQGVKSCGCTKESRGEQKIREILAINNINFENQKSFSDFKYEDTQGKPRYDFFLPDYNILIEYDGEQHFIPIENWGGEEGLKQRQYHDFLKNNYAIKNNYFLIRIPYTHYNNLSLEDLLLNSKFIINKENNNVKSKK